MKKRKIKDAEEFETTYKWVINEKNITEKKSSEIQID